MIKEDREAIADVLEKEILYRKTQDVEGLLALFTEDAVFIPPNEDPLKGKASLRRVFEKLFSTYEDMVLKTKIVDIVGMGDAAAVWYEIVLKLKERGNEATEHRGRGVVVFKKTGEGWKMHWDIWNTPAPIQD
jgi:uncharacterized protein (TIGR02246 family)